MARSGNRVFAGVRNPQDGTRLRSDAGVAIEPVQIDAADPASIAAAARFVEGEVGTSGLGGIMNNAGIGLTAPIEYVSSAELRARRASSTGVGTSPRFRRAPVESGANP